MGGPGRASWIEVLPDGDVAERASAAGSTPVLVEVVRCSVLTD